MPRRPVGDRALTPAERQAHQREKARARYDLLVEALQEVLAASYVTEARETAARALAAVRRGCLAP